LCAHVEHNCSEIRRDEELSHPVTMLGRVIERLEALAEAHHGVATRAQALAAGFTPAEIGGLLRVGRIVATARGVYRFPGSVPTWRQRLTIAAYAAGDGAVAAGLSAPAVWRLPGYHEGPIEILQHRGRSARPQVGRLRQTAFLPVRHVTEFDGIPVLRPSRMLFDICGRVHPGRAERTVDNALAMDLVSVAKLEVVLAECAVRGRPGSAVLRALLDVRGEGYVPPASELEALVCAVLDAAGLERPVRQREVGGTMAPVGRVDLAYPTARFLIEADSKRHHSSWLDVVADRQRDAKLTAAGFIILRVTWYQLVHEPELFVAAVRAVLRRAA
jgi:very-short-patch-repair endonuclease